ncbi:MAG: InlB B-repeat-containing protein [Lachnospiraceae bacterium]|nr:InlB B-repeat-containing protein [Lachnospiraceae bacterium]
MKKRRLTRSLFGVAMSAVLIGTQVMPAFAETDIGGTGNVLDYAIDTVVTPTSLAIALNPNGYDVVRKYFKTKDETPAENKQYYTYDDENDKYVKATLEEDENENLVFDDDTDYYEKSSSTDQVVSLNYAMVNKSTEDRVFEVEVKASYTVAANSTAKPIQFVETPEEAQAFATASPQEVHPAVTANPAGAKKNELKMYLALAAASQAANNNPSVTTDDVSKTKSSTYTAGTTYYTTDGTTFTKATSVNADNFGDENYYEDTYNIGTEIKSDQLSDVNMTVNATGQSAFKNIVNGGNDKVSSTIAFKLYKADFAFKAGETVDLTTTQAGLAQKLVLSKINGIAAFTITGYINKDADWTKADASAIKFTPVYDGTKEVDGTEEALTGAGYNQIKVAAKTVEVTVIHKGDLEQEDSKINMTIGSDATNPAPVTNYTFDQYYTDASCETAFEGKVTANTTTLYAKWNAVEYKVTFMNGETKVDEINVKYNNKIAANAKPADPTKAADNDYTYTFAGWYKEAQLTSEFDFDEDVITAATTLYAKFTATPKVITGTASFVDVGNNVYYLVLTGKDGAVFNADSTVSSVIINDLDVTSKAVISSSKKVAVATADFNTVTNFAAGSTLTITYTVDGTDYAATYTFGN